MVLILIPKINVLIETKKKFYGGGANVGDSP